MIAKLKAFFAYANGTRQVSFMDVLMLAVCLFDVGAQETIKTIEAVSAGAHGAAYWHGFMAIVVLGWMFETVVKAKGDTTT